MVEDEASWEDDDESGGEEEQEEEEVLQPMVVQEEEEDLHEEEEEEAMEEDSDEEVDRSGDESIEAEEEEEAVVPDVAPPVQNLPALPTTPSVRHLPGLYFLMTFLRSLTSRSTSLQVVPVSKTFYTPQVSRPDRSRQDLTRTMGPPVRVPASVGARGPVDRLLQSRPNLGSPIRAPKTRVVEDEVEVEDAVAVSERPSEVSDESSGSSLALRFAVETDMRPSYIIRPF